MGNKIYTDYDWLYENYVIKKTSTADMTIEAGVSKDTILKYLKKYNIPIRKKSTSIDTPLNDEWLLRYELFVNKMSYTKLMSKYDVSKNKIRRLVKKYNIDLNVKERRKLVDLSGENNPNYRGGPNYCHCGEKISRNATTCMKHRDISGEKSGMYGKTISEVQRKHLSVITSKRLKENNPMSNPESVRKIRIKAIDRIEKNRLNGNQLVPNYNKSSIPILENKAKELGIVDLQHAENGGEYYIKELGYWVDGYSMEKNIVIEYDERHHFDMNGELKIKDKKRQKEIEDYLGCQFIRIKE
jgi:hypothetical protein